MKLTEVTLDTVAGGAAPERFEHALAEVLENIQDPNTDPEEKRRIRIDLDFKPYEDRSGGAVTLSVKTKLAPMRPVPSQVHIGMKDGKLAAVTSDPRQSDLFDDPEEESDITPLPMPKEGDGGAWEVQAIQRIADWLGQKTDAAAIIA